MENRKVVTKWCTYALVVMSVVFAVVGFITGDRTVGQVFALTAVLAIFSWLLSECLENYIEHRNAKNWRQHASMGLGLFLLAVEIHLVHFGVEWLFPELDGPAFFGMPVDYLISAGFSSMTVFAKATFGYTYPPEAPTEVEDSDLADLLESVGGSKLIDDIGDFDVDRVIAA